MGETRTRTELLADEIAQKIRQKIQKQEYAQGERLTVRWLCEEFGASETPVKQALNPACVNGACSFHSEMRYACAYLYLSGYEE